MIRKLSKLELEKYSPEFKRLKDKLNSGKYLRDILKQNKSEFPNLTKLYRDSSELTLVYYLSEYLRRE